MNGGDDGDSKKKAALVSTKIRGVSTDDGSSCSFIKLQVGSSVFETTKEELQGGPDTNTYFRAMFSGRWGDDTTQEEDKETSSTMYTIQDRSGRLFQFVLY